jgi:hypothetical protein
MDKDQFEGYDEQSEEQGKDKPGDVIALPEIEAKGDQERVDGRTHDGYRQTRHEDQETEEKVEETFKKAHG